MDRWRAAGALLALAACIACTTAAPYASNQTSLDLYDGPSDGCYYNFQHYGEGDRIMTNEPCLNCTCHNRMLMCYLRVCPFTKPIGQDCTVEKRADQCCPIVTCPDVPVDLLTSTSTSSPAEYGSTGMGKLDKYGCSISGKYFPEGSKVPPTPNKPCEHCYCIRNMTTCVMQECTLHVDGCTPIYHKDVCCPVRYSCDHPEDEIPLLDDMTTTVRPTPGFLLTTTTLSPVTQMTQDCVHDDHVFPDGALIKTEKACEHCYCMKGDIVCVVQECGTPMENEGKNCTSMPPREGQCCPDTYICEGDDVTTDLTTPEYEDRTTQVPTRRVEGSGYRDIPEESYTEAPTLEPEFEGSGEVQMTLEPAEPTDIPDKKTPGLHGSTLMTIDELLQISTTTKPVVSEEPEKQTTDIDEGQNTVPSGFEESSEPSIVQKTTVSVHEELTEPPVPSEDKQTLSPESHVISSTVGEESQTVSPDLSITSAPDSDEKQTLSPESHVTSSTVGEESQTVSPDLSITSAPDSDEKYTLLPEEHVTSPLDSSDRQTASPDVDVTLLPESEYKHTTPEVSMSLPDSEEKQTVSPDVGVTSQPVTEEQATVSPDVSMSSVPDSEEKQTISPEVKVTSQPDSEEQETVSPDVSVSSVPDSEEKQTISPDVKVTSQPDSEEQETVSPVVSVSSMPDSEEKQTVSPDVRVTTLPDSEDKETVSPDIRVTSISDSENEQTISPDVTATSLLDSVVKQTMSPVISVTLLPESGEEPTESSDLSSTPLLDNEEKQTTTPEDLVTKEKPTALPEFTDTSLPDSDQKGTVSPDISVTSVTDSEEKHSKLPEIQLTTVPDIYEKPTISPDVRITSLPDSEDKLTTSPDVSLTTLPGSEDIETISSEGSVTSTSDIGKKQTVSPDVSVTSGETEEAPEVHETSLPDVDDKQTVYPGAHVTSLPDSSISTEYEYTITTVPSSKIEESTDALKETSTHKYEEKVTTSEPDVKVDLTTTETAFPTIEQEAKSTTVQLPEFTYRIEETGKPEIPEEHTEVSVEMSTSPNLSVDEKEASITTSAVQEETLPLSTTPSKFDAFETTTLKDIETGRIPGEGDCLLDGTTYRNNSEVASYNKCYSSCKCVSSIIKCDPIICSPPPEDTGMDNCMQVYDTEDSCCPTYVCDDGRRTIPPESHSHVSGTESPTPTQMAECSGEECHLDAEKKPKPETGECGPEGCGEIQTSVHLPPVPTIDDCTDGKCQESPTKEIPCNKELGCELSHSIPCEGENCVSSVEPKPVAEEALCSNEEECKKVQTPDIEGVACENGACKTTKPEGKPIESDTIPCEGNECKIEDKTTSTEIPPQSCENDKDCKETKIPDHEKPPCRNDDCEFVPPKTDSSLKPIAEPCEGEKCETESNVISTGTSFCEKEGNCKEPDVIQPGEISCEGENCKTASDVPPTTGLPQIDAGIVPSDNLPEQCKNKNDCKQIQMEHPGCLGENCEGEISTRGPEFGDCVDGDCRPEKCRGEECLQQTSPSDQETTDANILHTESPTIYETTGHLSEATEETLDDSSSKATEATYTLHDEIHTELPDQEKSTVTPELDVVKESETVTATPEFTEISTEYPQFTQTSDKGVELQTTLTESEHLTETPEKGTTISQTQEETVVPSEPIEDEQKEQTPEDLYTTRLPVISTEESTRISEISASELEITTRRSSTQPEAYDEKDNKTEEIPHVTSSEEYTTESPQVSESHEIMKTTTLSSTDIKEISTKIPEMITEQEESSTVSQQTYDVTKSPSTEKQEEVTRYVPEDTVTNIPESDSTKIPELEQPSPEDISTKVPESESGISEDHTHYEEEPKVTEISVDETTKHLQISEEPVTESSDQSTKLPKHEIDEETELPDTHVKPSTDTSGPVEYETELPISPLTDQPPSMLPDLISPTTEIIAQDTTEPSIFDDKLSTKITADFTTPSDHVKTPLKSTTVQEDYVTKEEVSEEQTVQTLSPESMTSIKEQESTVSPVESVSIAESASTSESEISETEPPLSHKPEYDATTEVHKPDLPEVVVTEVPERDEYTTKVTELERTTLFGTEEMKETHGFDVTEASVSEEMIKEKVEKTTELPSRRYEETSTPSLDLQTRVPIESTSPQEISTKESRPMEVESATEFDETSTRVEAFTETGISEPYIPVHEEKTSTKSSMTITEEEFANTEHPATTAVPQEHSSSEEYDHVTKGIEEQTAITESTKIIPEKSESESPVDQEKESEKVKPEKVTESLDITTGQEINTEASQTFATESIPKPSKRPEDNIIDQEELTERPESISTQEAGDEEATVHYITKEPDINIIPESQVTSQEDIVKTEKPKEHELPSTESYAAETKAPEIIPTQTLPPPREDETEIQIGTEPPGSKFTDKEKIDVTLPEEQVTVRVFETERPEIQQSSTESLLSPSEDKETDTEFPVTESRIPIETDDTKGQDELVTEKTVGQYDKEEEQETEPPVQVTEKIEIPIVTESYEIPTKLIPGEQPGVTDLSIEVTTKLSEETETEKVTKLPEDSSKSPEITTSEPQYKFSETTPYLVELEEHTHKVEIGSTIFEAEATTRLQETDVTTPLLEVLDITTEKHVSEEEQTELPKDELEKPSSDKEKLFTTTEEPHITESHTSTFAEEEQEPHRTETPLISEIESTALPASEVQEESKAPTDITKEDDKEITSQPLDKDQSPTISSVPETEQPAVSDIDITVQPVKEYTPTTQQPAVPEEEEPTDTSKTPSKSEEVQTPTSPYDMFTKPEEKPTEAYPLPTQASEVPKPPHGIQQVDEIPTPEEEGHFPPSGTGYGHEPDYMEEDQAFGPGTCRYGGKVYVSAQQIPRDDPCDFCFCFRSDIICLQQSCPPPIHGCHEEPIQGFCCPRYECPVSMATTLNVTTTTTTTTTTLPPHFLPHAYKGMAQRRGCQIKGHTYKVGEVVRASSGPCLHCTCGGDGQMKCDPKACTPEPMLRQMIAAAVSSKRRR